MPKIRKHIPPPSKQSYSLHPSSLHFIPTYLPTLPYLSQVTLIPSHSLRPLTANLTLTAHTDTDIDKQRWIVSVSRIKQRMIP